jgi:hypothetical protein
MSGDIEGAIPADLQQALQVEQVQQAHQAQDERAALQAQIDEMKSNMDVMRSMEEQMHDMMIDTVKNLSVDLSDHAHDGAEVVAYADDAAADGWSTHAHDSHDATDVVDSSDSHDAGTVHDAGADVHHVDAPTDDGTSA